MGKFRFPNRWLNKMTVSQCRDARRQGDSSARFRTFEMEDLVSGRIQSATRDETDKPAGACDNLIILLRAKSTLQPPSRLRQAINFYFGATPLTHRRPEDFADELMRVPWR